jgi:hypothetical protein
MSLQHLAARVTAAEYDGDYEDGDLVRDVMASGAEEYFGGEWAVRVSELRREQRRRRGFGILSRPKGGRIKWIPLR